MSYIYIYIYMTLVGYSSIYDIGSNPTGGMDICLL